MSKVIKIAKIFNFMAVARLKLLKAKNIDSKEEIYYKEVKRWAEYTMKTLGVKIQTEGINNVPVGNCLFVANHQSYVDIPLILSQIDKPIGFIAKKQLKKVPLMSFWMKKIHCVFLDRDSLRDAIGSINQGVKNLRNQSSMVIFPEGTRSRSDKIGEFKKGSMKLALKASVPIIPITICGSYKAYEEFNTVKPANVRLVIGKPIYTDALSKEEKIHLSEHVKSIIQANYAEI
ncbi:lysophospholipid acyltransferase family protein [Clostridium thermarum]|uniref:lysophospholipid acyltransferase family protein n=1 Tax=Clostridium thermarum TaxID=1716543 RepID=UPI0013D1E012|nr:lysophospholipid acyltransferase family protein [Clostridium thermarum]